MDLASYEESVWEFFKNKEPDLEGCIFCQGPAKLLFTKNTMRVHRCYCGFVYNKQQPSQKDLNEFYEKSDAMAKWSSFKKGDMVRQFEKYQKAIDYMALRGVNSVLDVGCGNGFFLEMVKSRLPGCEVVGVEQGKAAINAGLEMGLNIQDLGKQALHEFIKEGPKYDCITLWGVLEHVKDPIKILRSISQKLKGPKLVIVCVPNVESEVVTRLWQKCFTFCPQHLWYFSIKTLTRAIERAGLHYKDSWTIESEALPVAKTKMGFDPYSHFSKNDEKDFLDRSYMELEVESKKILEEDKGYKIVLCASG